MEIKIDKDGLLHIQRIGKDEMQKCPYHCDNEGYKSACGDWCPLFGEIIYQGLDIPMDRLQICNGRYLTGTIIDERGGHDPKLDEIAARKAASDKAYAEACK